MRESKRYIVLEEGDISKYFGYLDDKVKYPQEIQRKILKVILDRLCIESDECGDELRELFKLIPREEIEYWIEIIDNLYSEEGKVEYENIKNAYLAYYLPINTFKIHRLLRDLLMRNLIKVEVDILDIACGPGSATIGFIEFYKILALSLENVNFKVSITLLDSEEEFLTIADNLINKIICDLPSNLEVTLEEVICCKIDKNFELKSWYDYIIVSNLLNGAELDNDFKEERFFKEIISSTYDAGAMLLIEPGEQRQCERLKSIRNKVLTSFDHINIYSPCNDIWGCKEGYDCSCFTNGKVNWEKPYIMKKLSDYGLRKRVDEVAFNYLILRKDGKKKYAKECQNSNYTKIIDVPQNKGKLINVKGIVRCVMKQPNYLWVSICDGTSIMTEDKHVYLSINLSDSQIVNKWSNCLKSMNLGEKIEVNNVKCIEMWKYKGSYLLEINNDSKITVFF